MDERRCLPHQGGSLLGVTAIRHVGDYLLTAHSIPCEGKFLPELLISKPGGITLHRYQLRSVAFADQSAAYDYARRWMAACHVSSTGSVSTP
ncbi:hypothetical protein XaplCFBP3123_17990 [Xanthomonas arboricola pv. populi]|nr:hypothetical protein XaplCFBP3123_17990 [Xanthomonas arboricola pv. populi]